MKKIFNILYLLGVVLLFSIFVSQSMLSIASAKLEIPADTRWLGYSVFLLTALCIGFCFFHSRPKSDTASIFFVLMVYICGVSMIIHESGISTNELIIQFCKIVFPILLLWYFYYIPRIVDLRITLLIIFVAYVILLYSFIDTYYLTLLYSLSDDTVSSSSYILLFLLPFFLLSNNKWLKISLLIFVFGVMVISMKRGGFVSMIVATLVYYLVFSKIKGKRFKTASFLWALLIVLIVSGISYFLLDNYLDSMLGRFSDLKDDQGSGRLEIYQETWEMIIGSDLPAMIFGHGWDMVAVDSTSGYSAHNDFLEVFYDFGIVGLVFYFLFWVQLIKSSLKLIRKKSENAPSMSFSITVFAINSLVAHIIIYPFYLGAFAAVWGFIYGRENYRVMLLKNQTI